MSKAPGKSYREGISLDKLFQRERFPYGAFFPIGNFCPV